MSKNFRSKADLINVFRNFSDEIFRYIYFNFSFTKEDSQDIVQEIFMRIWEKRTAYDPSKGQIRTWLYKVSRNYAIDIVRKKSLKFRDLDHYKNQISSSTDSIIITNPSLVLGLSYLETFEKELIILKYINGLSFIEIAEIYEKSDSALKVASHRAIKKLRLFLEKYERN